MTTTHDITANINFEKIIVGFAELKLEKKSEKS